MFIVIKIFLKISKTSPVADRTTGEAERHKMS